MMQELNEKDWAYSTLNVKKSWAYLSVEKLSQVKVAYIDTGCSAELDYFNDVPIICVDSDGNVSSTDHVGHGTFYGSVLARYLFYKDKVYPNIISIKAGDSSQLSITELCKSIQLAIDYHVDVLNIGACNFYYNPNVAQLIAKAIKTGMIVISPSGNNISEITTYPAALDTVIACASLNRDMQYFERSNVAEFIDVFVPGENIIGILPSEQMALVNADRLPNEFLYLSGTSFAAAILAAAAVFLKAVQKNLNHHQFRHIIYNFSSEKCKVELSKGIKIERKVLDFSLLLAWLADHGDKISLSESDQKYTHWFINSSDKVWSAEAYNQYGELASINAEKLHVEIYSRNNLEEALDHFDVSIHNGKAQWEFQTLKGGQYIIKIKDDKTYSVSTAFIITILPDRPEVDEVIMKENGLQLTLKDSLNKIYYAFKNNTLKVDPQKGPLKETYLYDKEDPIILTKEQEKVVIACFGNGVFSQTLNIEYSQFLNTTRG